MQGLMLESPRVMYSSFFPLSGAHVNLDLHFALTIQALAHHLARAVRMDSSCAAILFHQLMTGVLMRRLLI